MLKTKCPACGEEPLTYGQEEVYCDKCHAFRRPYNLFRKALTWANDKQWWWRLPIFLWFVAMLFQNIDNPAFALNRLSNPFSAIDLGIHELGHLIFSLFGTFMHILGGSLFQCLFPLLWLIGFIQQKWYFAAVMCFGWLGLNLFDVAAYVADARARLLPLAIGVGGLAEQGNDDAYDQAHDWYQILSRTKHLNSDLAIAHGLRIAAVISFLICLTLSGILLVRMMFFKTPENRNPAS